MRQTRKCLDEIDDLFQSRSAGNGSELIDRVVDLYFMTVDQQSVEDKDTFGDVMTRMAFAGDALTRARLAERVSRAGNAPKELLLRLACDEIIVARPVLQYSTCLRDGDLISIIGQVEEDLVKEGYFEALKDSGLKAIAITEIEEGKYVEGEDFRFTAYMEVLPEFEPVGYRGIEIPGIDTGVTEEEVMAEVDLLREMQAVYKPVERESREKDLLEISRSEERRVGKECRSRWSPYH